MNYSLEELLLIDDFSRFSQKEVLEIIKDLKFNLKYYKFQKDSDREKLINTLSELKTEISELKKHIDFLKKANANISKNISRPLTLKERILGKITPGK